MRRLNFGLKALEAAYLTPAHAKTCKNIVKKFLLKAPREWALKKKKFSTKQMNSLLNISLNIGRTKKKKRIAYGCT